MRNVSSFIKALKMVMKPFFIHVTYYPEEERKTLFRQRMELILGAIKTGTIEKYYYPYGFDCMGKNMTEYVDYHTFQNNRDKYNKLKSYNYVCLLRDKTLFSQIGASYGLPVVKDVDIVQNGKLQNYDNVSDILEKYDHLFCKPIDAKCGDGSVCLDKNKGCYYIENKQVTRMEIDNLFTRISTTYTIQPRIVQHEVFNNIYPNSVNTLRIVTVNPDHSFVTDNVVVMCVLLRIGAHGSKVDNWAKGGLIVGVDENGKLLEYGIYKPGYGTKTDRHPDTGVLFNGIQVPYYKEAIETAKRFHSKLYHIHSIGWDVAITDEGPVFIEGNDSWELGFVQIVNGGIRSQLNTYFK